MNDVLSSPALIHHEPDGLHRRVRLDPELLKARRHQLGLSQEAFARACTQRQLCVSIASVKRAETGKSLHLRTARHLAAFHGISLQTLLWRGPARAAGFIPMPAVEEAVLLPHPDAAMEDTRRVQVLCLWPVPPAQRARTMEALRAQGALPMPAHMNDASGDAMLAVFSLPRARRGDMSSCVRAARSWAGSHAVLAGGLWREGVLEWPQLAVQACLRGEPGGVYAHRSAISRLRALQEPLKVPGHDDLFRLGASAHAHGKGALVGRHQEVRVMQGLLDAVVGEQQGQVLVVRGMAGMGKSCLMSELHARARLRFVCTVMAGVDDLDGDRHQSVMASLLQGLLGLEPSGAAFWPQLLGQRLLQLGLDAAHKVVCKEMLAVGLSPDEKHALLALDDAERAHHLAQALGHIVVKMASQRPLLIVLEDVHRAPARAIDVLAQAMSATRASPVLWALSSCVSAPERLNQLQRILPDAPITCLSLAPLKAHEVQEWMASRFSHVHEAVRRQCAQRAQGHPLFLAQLLGTGQADRLPDDFLHYLQVLLDEVAPLDRRALRLAAMSNGAFGIDDLRTWLQAPRYQPDALVRHGLIRCLGGDRYDFLHPMVRQGMGELPATLAMREVGLRSISAWGTGPSCAQSAASLCE